MTPKTIERDRPEAWAEAFAAGRRRMQELTDGLTGGQLAFKPAPDRWSVAECLDHLTVSMRVYLDRMEPVVEKARAAGRTGGESRGRGPWMGRLLIRALRKPGARYPAPRMFRPRVGSGADKADRPDVPAELEEELGRMERALERCHGLALDDIEIPWPVFGLIKLSLAQAFELQALHLHRHLDQAERVVDATDFPPPERRSPPESG